MGISKSAYYYIHKRSGFPGIDLADRINDVATEFPTYGFRGINMELKRNGIYLNYKIVYNEPGESACKKKKNL